MLSGELAVLQAPMFDGLSLDPFTLFDDGTVGRQLGSHGNLLAQIDHELVHRLHLTVGLQKANQ